MPRTRLLDAEAAGRAEGAEVAWGLLRRVGVLCVLALVACRQDMHDTPSYEAFEESDFFGDGRASRPRVEGTVARGELAADERAPVTLDLLRRGRQRYDIFCSPCHGRTGRGDGMVVRRGYRSPSSFHLERLRAQPDAYFFDVVTNGFGAMPSYAGQVPVADRWAIVAYLRALQLSQNVPAAELSEAARRELAGAAPAAAGTQVHR